MTLQVKDRVWDLSLTTGTGTITLLNTPPNAYQSFGAACSNNDTIYYSIANQSVSEWEVGLGTFGTSGPTLARTTVFASSNAGALVNFSAGTKDVTGVWPAKRTNIGTPTQGAVVVGDGSEFIPFPVGVANQILSTQPTLKLFPTPGTAGNWSCIDGLSGGSFLIAGDAGAFNGTGNAGGYLYTTSNLGQSWTKQTGSGVRSWACVGCSSDGSTIYAGEDAVDISFNHTGYIYQSTDGGVTWTAQTGVGNSGWRHVVCSANGQTVVACHGDEWGSQAAVQISTNGGSTWSAGPHNASSAAVSSDGQTIYTTGLGSGTWKSTNAGSTFSSIGFATSTVFCSPDASIVWLGSQISTNGGTSFTDRSANFPAGTGNLQHISADGQSLVWVSRAASPNSAVYASTNGATSAFTLIGVDQGANLAWWTAWVDSTGKVFAGVTGGDFSSKGIRWIGTNYGLRWIYGNNWLDIKDFGAAGDGVTDDSAAFLAFQNYANTAPSLAGLNLLIPPGHYVNSTTNFFVTNQAQLTIWGYGASLNYGGGGSIFADNTHSALIASTTPGDASITLLTPSQHTIFAVGNWVAVMSVSMQGASGFPNNFNVEYHQIASINTITGVMGLDTHIRYAHLSTYLHPNPGASPDVGGPATVFLCASTWNSEVTFYGLTYDNSGGTGIAMRKANFIDCDFTLSSNFGPSGSQEISMDRCSWSFAEMDKNIEVLRLTDCRAETTVFQSASIMKVIMDGCTFDGSMSGCPRQWTIRDCVINVLNLQSHFGHTETLLLQNSQITQLTYDPTGASVNFSDFQFTGGSLQMTKATGDIVNFWQMMVPGARLLFVGTDPFMAATVVLNIREDNSFVKGTVTGSITGTVMTVTGTPGFTIAIYDLITGTGVTAGTFVVNQLTGTPGGGGGATYTVSPSSSATGSITLTDTYPGFYYADTPLAALPSFTGTGSPVVTSVQVAPVNQMTISECTGAAGLVSGPNYTPGRAFHQYTYNTSMGLPFTNGGINNVQVPAWGKLVQIRINVVKAYTGAKANVQLNMWQSYYTSANVRVVISQFAGFDVINLKQVGQRLYTPGSTTGSQAGDSLNTLPVGAQLNGSLTYMFLTDISSDTPDLWPWVELEFITDQGPIVNMNTVITGQSVKLW